MDRHARIQIIGGDCMGYSPGSKGTVITNCTFESNGQPAVKVTMDRDKKTLFFVPHIEVEYLQPWRHVNELKGIPGRNYCSLCKREVIWKDHLEGIEHWYWELHSSLDDWLKYRNPSDARCKCSKCRGWMRSYVTEKTPLLRALPPHANVCVKCLRQERK
jgi:hypothetical protein